MLTQQHRDFRKQGVFASDIAIIAGLSAFKRSSWELYLDKTGAPLPDEESDDMRMGTILEPFVGQMYCLKKGVSLYPVSPVLKGWQGASPDGRSSAGQLVEIKTSRQWSEWGEEGTDEIPAGYIAQCQWQMAVFDAPEVDVAAFVCGEFRLYHVQRNDKLIAALTRLGREFWDRVEKRNAPEPDWTSRRTTEILNAINPPEKLIASLGNPESVLASEYERVSAEIKRLEEAKNDAKNRLLFSMHEANEGHLPDGRILKRGLVHRNAYEVKESSYTTFSIKTPKEKKNGSDSNGAKEREHVSADA